MGFEVRKRYRLEWGAGTEFEGATIVMYSMSIGEMFHLDELTTQLRVSDDHAEQLQAVRERAEMIAKHVAEWDLVYDGEPLPVAADSCLLLEPKQLTTLINEWTRAVTKVTPPLSNGSHDGEPYPEASIPMEALSPLPES